MRRFGLALGLGATLALPAAAQNTVRWNDVVASLGDLDATPPPAVRVWLDRRIAHWGEPIRVNFRAEEDAFVIVARVDSDGRLTVLFPAGRTRATEVRGGVDNFIRSNGRLGGFGTFAAAERPGSTGFIFALSSRTPMDLTRLRNNDFSAWVTGTARMAPASRYFGDPYRVIQRFARVVSYSEKAEFDYDFEYYSVDQPAFVSASNSCGFSNWGYSRRLGGWNRGLLLSEFDPFYGLNGWGGCGAMYDCLMPGLGMWWTGMPYYIPLAVGGFCGSGQYPTQVASSNPVQPPVAPPLDGTVNPWVPDSIGRPNVDKQDQGGNGGSVNGPHIMSDRPDPTPGVWKDRDDLSFSIPSRALRAMRGANRADEGPTPINAPGATGSGPMPMPTRPQIEVAKDPVIEWVRPPRSFNEPVRDPVEERLPRQDFGPPPRAGSPMFDREPGFMGFGSNIRTMGGSGVWNGGSTGSFYSPPPTFQGEGRPMSGQVFMGSGSTGSTGTSSAGTGSAGSSGTSGGAASSPPPSAAASGTAGGEKKPHQ
jgi:hypothetical protein